jgi:alpha-amylase/alpha-mannosidase (GH57 family)
MSRFLCIHAHFYQPPRESPWLEAIELQDSAYPYHDWNERITAECYAPNSAARILDGEGRIVEIVNSYSKISFNFGPTLLSYLADKRPEVYRAILKADQESRKLHTGHGSALAQAHNHMILPLASRRDKLTQLRWGIRDFESRFGRKPEGLWLPETAVDLESLDLLAQLGVRFTVLAPHQAQRVRKLGEKSWEEVGGARIDPTRAYRQRLPSGHTIDLFFYDGPISRAVAFERLLARGEHLADRLVGAFSAERTWSQLVHIATDGETYGHHHRYGDMALAYALHYIQSRGRATLTVYGEFLERHPPEYEVEIIENTSWSCGHGIERWRSDCGCNSGGRPGWSQSWRRPLRQALDWLRDTLAPRFEKKCGEYLKDPWEARDDYIDVILDRSTEALERFLAKHATRSLAREEKSAVLKLLELQRHAMLMYTSCGWFFDDLSGIETVQVIRYAGRALQLSEELFGDGAEPYFLKLLEGARSNLREHGDGRQVYENHVRPSMVNLEKVAAHHAISSLFDPHADRARTYCYTVETEHYHKTAAGQSKFVTGRVRVTSEITLETAKMSFGVLHFGDHHVNAGVRGYSGEAPYQSLIQEGKEALRREDFATLIRYLDKQFGSSTYSLKSLFRDEQRRVLDLIMRSTLRELEEEYREAYENRSSLMRFVAGLGMPLPRALQVAADFVLNTALRQALDSDSIDPEQVKVLLEDAKLKKVPLDQAGLAYTFGQSLERLAGRFRDAPEDSALLTRLSDVVELMRVLPFDVDLWKVQNIYYDLLQETYPQHQKRAEGGESGAGEWVAVFRRLGARLWMRVP